MESPRLLRYQVGTGQHQIIIRSSSAARGTAGTAEANEAVTEALQEQLKPMRL